jgi:hypothetical protein
MYQLSVSWRKPGIDKKMLPTRAGTFTAELALKFAGNRLA